MFDTIDVAYNELIKVVFPDTTLSPFCQFFINLRCSHNLTVEEFSRILGISSKQIDEIEQGKIWGNITPKTISTLENIFDIKKGSIREQLKQSYLV